MNILRQTKSRARERVQMNLRPLGIPEIPMIGRYNYSHAHLGLQQHAHPRTMEICFLAKGMQLYRVGRRDYILSGGDLFVTFPGEQHSTGGTPEEKGMLYWIQVILPPRGSRFLNCTPADSRELSAQLLAIRHRHFKGAPILQTLLDEIIRTASSGPKPLHRIAIISKLNEFLLEVLECARRNPKSNVSPAITRALGAIDAKIGEPVAIGRLAAQAGLSVSRFKTRFKRETGIPPAEYIQRCKIAAAMTLLGNRNLSITDIAFRLGFSSSQYFATVFKRYTGQSPRVMRRLEMSRIGFMGNGVRNGKRISKSVKYPD